MLRGGFGRLVDTCREKAFLSSVSLFHQRWQRIGIRILRFLQECLLLINRDFSETQNLFDLASRVYYVIRIRGFLEHDVRGPGKS